MNTKTIYTLVLKGIDVIINYDFDPIDAGRLQPVLDTLITYSQGNEDDFTDTLVEYKSLVGEYADDHAILIQQRGQLIEFNIVRVLL